MACASQKCQISYINVCLRPASGLAATRKKVSGAPDKDWVPLPSLQQRVRHLRCTNTDYLSSMEDTLLLTFSHSWEFNLKH